MLIQGMYGLGDNVYQRAIVREVPERVYLITSWPQLYADLPNIRPVRAKTKLRTQRKNLQRIDPGVWHTAPSLPVVRMSYSSGHLKHGSILRGLGKCVGQSARVFDMPKFENPITEKRYAIVRPVTVRSEWCNRARGPKPEYVCQAADILRKRGYTVVSVADIATGEWCERVPESDATFNHGELSFEALMGAVQGASLVVGGVGWIVPVCAAAGVPLVTILGGQGGHNAPEKIIDKPMNTKRIRFVYPDKYCMCTDQRHVCEKTITDFPGKFNQAVDECLSN